MCGIAGFCDFSKRSDETLLRRMTDAVAHRGPNDAGYEMVETPYASIGLGHRRLSILDLSSSGHQPMSFANLKIVFNGEIYNFKEIRKELEVKGYSFNSGSDTEVILKGYHCWKEKVVTKFIGMFAIVIYDSDKQELTIYRDRAGVKPLYYYWDGQLLLFCSELKSMYQHPAFRKKIDINSLSLFLQYSYIPNPYTIFERTYKLRPGHLLKVSLPLKIHQEKKYWSVLDFYNLPKLVMDEREAEEEVEKLLLSAYQYRLVSDVPVGIFLSGGYDSSSVAALLQSNSTEKLKTFTIGYREDDFNEAVEAKKIAAYLGTDHHEWYVTAKDAEGVLNQLPEIYDEPFADNSTVPTLLVSRLAATKVKVALSADGGDEIFAGYNKFNQSVRFTEGMPFWLQTSLSKSMNLLNPEYLPYFNRRYNFSTRYEKMKKIWSSRSAVTAMKYISQYTTPKETRQFLRADFVDYRTNFDIEPLIGRGNDSINKMLAVDYQTFLVDNNLVKVDRATMSVSIEGREPMLDHRVIELISRLPSDLKIRKGVNKYLLKRIVHKYIPRELMDRPKRPFLAPLTIWFRDELKEKMNEYLNAEKLGEHGFFNIDVIIKLRDKYQSGEKINYQKLWNVMVFQLWYERWM